MVRKGSKAVINYFACLCCEVLHPIKHCADLLMSAYLEVCMVNFFFSSRNSLCMH